MKKFIAAAPAPPAIKTHVPCALFLVAMLFCSCSSTKFTQYHGTEVFHGKGGEVRSVENIDIWESGEPDRAYKILGLVEKSRGQRLPLGKLSKLVPSSGGDKDSTLVKFARDHGGDAVVIVGGERESSFGDDDDDGGQSHRRSKKYVVIKYVR